MNQAPDSDLEKIQKNKFLKIFDAEIDITEKHFVILGANGSGKSSIGHDLAKKGAERITANRSIVIPETIPMQSFQQASAELKNHQSAVSKTRNYYLSDFDVVTRALLAEQTEHSLKIRSEIENGRENFSKEDACTKLTEVAKLWSELFPFRSLTFKDHKPVVLNSLPKASSTYQQNEMSDGERQALYMTAKIFLLPDVSEIVVDEPEIHLHPVLCRRLWDRIEAFKPNSRFIYLTHDLTFAIGRKNATLAIVRNPGQIEILKDVDGLPEEIVRDIIGGATTSIRAERIFFCEGDKGSLDISFLETWFDSEQVTVYPVGSCEDVELCVRSFNESGLVKGVSAAGIVDRDERCQEEIDYLKVKGIHVLPVAEMEHLFSVPEIVSTVAEYHGKEKSEIADLLGKLKERLINYYKDKIHIHALKAAQDEIRWKLTFPTAKISPGPDKNSAQKELSASYDQCMKNLDPTAIYENSYSQLAEALDKDIVTILRSFSGKVSLSIASDVLDLKPKAYMEIVMNILKGKLGESLKSKMRKSFTSYLPQ